jgi:acrylyl-CoA reductase (NADPH)
MFNAVVIDELEGPPKGRLAQLDDGDLPAGSVSLDIAFSSLNYKDALAITGTAPIARKLPMVAGVDLAGTVTDSSHHDYVAGDEVLATGYGIGESHWGGLAQRARLDGGWLVPLPATFTSLQAMQIGTAGFTAMLCVLALEDRGILPDDGEILVTGANGGVGGVAIAVLARLGYHVVASTGRPAEGEYLRRLGAIEIIDRAELSEPGKALGKERWAGAVDAVGGQTLANVCATTRYGGTVTACGNAGGMKLPATVAPFILRGVTLAGIDSVHTPRERRLEAWQRLSTDLDPTLLDALTDTIGLSDVIGAAQRVLAGEVRGRLVVDTNR